MGNLSSIITSCISNTTRNTNMKVIALFLLFGGGAVFGEDIVGYAKKPHSRGRAGYFDIYDCSDSHCDYCNLVASQPTHFGICMPATQAPTDCIDYYQIIHCKKGKVSVSTWTNAQCKGKPK